MRKFLYLQIGLMLLLVSSSVGQIPQTLTYQGVLTYPDGKVAADGNYSLVFKIYNHPTEGAILWSETQMVELKAGIFNVLLGKLQPLTLPFDQPYWLGTTVGQGPELTPRTELTAAAYSLNTRSIADSVVTDRKIVNGQVVRSLNSLTDHVTLKAGENIIINQLQDTLIIASTAPGVASLDQAYDAGGPGLGRTILADAGAVSIQGPHGLTVNGNVGIGTTNPLHQFHVLAPDAVGLFESSGNQAYLKLATKEGIDHRVEIANRGSGRLSLWTVGGGDVLNITREGNVGIATTTPTQKLEVAGTVQMTGFKLTPGAVNNYVLTSDANGLASWKPPQAVGIGGSGNPGYLSRFGATNLIANSILFENDSKIGLGTLDPKRLLHLANPTNATLLLEDLGAAANQRKKFIASDDGQLRLGKLDDALAATTQLTILNDGKIGIGLENPTQLLDVNGVAQMTGFKLPTGAADGFVLTADATGAGNWKAVGGFSGAGLTHYLPKFTGAANLGNSILYETNGKIGLGTTTPLSPLHINAGTDTLADLTIRSLHGRPMLEIYRDAETWGQTALKMLVNSGPSAILRVSDEGSAARADFRIQTNATDRLVISNGGYLGLGTNQPQAPLDLNYLSQVYTEDFNLAQFAYQLPTGRSVDFHINYLGKTLGDGTLVFREDRAGQDFLVVNLLSQANRVYFPNGNVGIGTATPDARLKIVNDSRSLGADQLHVFDTIDANEAFGGIRFGIANNAERAAIRGYGDYSLCFLVRDNTDHFMKERCRIKTNGNVGIGVMDPVQKLDVAGTVQMTGFKMPTGANNGYVLTADANGTASWTQPSTGNIGGSGITDYLCKFTSPTSIASSNLYEKNGQLSIGTITPDANALFTVEGTQARPWALQVVGHYGTSINRPTGLYTGLKTTASSTYGYSIYSSVTDSDNPAILRLFGNAIYARSDVQGNICWGMLIDLSGNNVGQNDGALQLSARAPGYSLYSVGDGPSYFAGRVGIGFQKWNPAYALDVKDTVRVGGFRMEQNGASQGRVLTCDDRGVGTWQAVSAAADNAWTISGNNLYAAVTGNVGIGTASPQRTLHLAHASNVSLVLEDLGATANQRKKFINTDGGLLRFGKFDEAWTFNAQMTINNDGCVGIGTESPRAKLQLENSEFKLPGTSALINFESTEFDTYGRDLLKLGGEYMTITGKAGYRGIAFHVNDKFAIWRRSMGGQPSTDIASFVIVGSGAVGIGTTNPTRIFTINQGSGRPIADAWDTYSSRRWKTNIQPLQHALAQVQQLQGVRFNWKENGQADIGLIAEEVGKVVPEVVTYEANGVDAQSVDYARLVSVLIEAVKEQQQQIQTQQATIEHLLKRVSALEK
ncbi:tail fiber domain-containing protein [candidate division KSB1 bacterium]|nr:tail fiber domain-containing protein [candidate division KSB1 bacterium]